MEEITGVFDPRRAGHIGDAVSFIRWVKGSLRPTRASFETWTGEANFYVTAEPEKYAAYLAMKRLGIE